MTLGLQKKLLLILALSIVLPVGVVGYIGFRVVQETVVEQIRTEMLNQAENVVDDLQQFLRQRRKDTLIIAENPAIRDYYTNVEYGLREEAGVAREKLERFLLEYWRREPVYAQLRFLDEGGQEIVKVTQGQVIRAHRSRAGAEYFVQARQAAEGEVYISPFTPSEDLQVPVLRFGTPVRNPWQEVRGVIVLDVSVTIVREMLDRVAIAKTGYAFLVDRQSHVVGKVAERLVGAGREGQPGPAAAAELLPILRRMQQGQPGMGSFGGAADFSYIAYRPIPEMGWSVGLVAPSADYRERITTLRGYGALITGLIVVLGVAAIGWTIRRITGPIQKLEAATSRVAEGHLDQEIELRSRDELGRLAVSFNAMVRSLRQRNQEIRTRGEEVMQRNKELLALNAIIGTAARSLDLRELLHAALDKVLDVMNLEVGAVRLLDEATGLLQLVAHRGLSEQYLREIEVLRVGEGMTGRVVQSGEPILVEDIHEYPKLVERVMRKQGLESFVAVPLKSKEKVLGAMSFSSHHARKFSPMEVNLLVSIGHQIGSFIENARLYEETRRALSELKEMHEHLVQSEKLSAVGRLVAGVAHELNNPLTSVLIFSETLLGWNLQGNAHKAVERIHTDAERCAKIVRNLLAFARRQEAEKTLVNLNELIERTVELLTYQLKVENIGLHLELAPDLPATVADPHQLQQVFVNIITNAIEAMAPAENGGRLAISSSRLGDLIQLRFQDSGPGIPEEILGKIFDPFFTTKDVGKGTGLGLSLAYGIIQEHEGRIYVRSRPGAGTTFFVEIPVRVRDGGWARPEEGAEHPRGLPRRVLVVDDEPHLLEILRENLPGHGIRVETASDGEKAMQILRRRSFDVVLCDVKMPQVAGSALYASIREELPDVAERFIFMTGDIVSESSQAFLKQAARPYIMKPFSLDELIAFLERPIPSGRNQPE
ncbi:MAG: response regulator [Deltaproteobacteria bacterium]|nr:response regulator [Deltaproteobacteria bacterium]